MVSLIRTETFLKYARLHLQEAEVALQEDDCEKAAKRCADVATTLIKAVSAGLANPQQEKGHELGENDLSRLLSNFTETKDEASGISRDLIQLMACANLKDDRTMSRTDAERFLSIAGRSFGRIHDLLVSGDQ